MPNIDKRVVEDFGKEWNEYQQESLSSSELSNIFNAYFSILPKNFLNRKLNVADFGCGTGRWAQFIAPLVGEVHCIDPSNAIEVCKTKLLDCDNCIFHQSSIDELAIDKNTLDFGYSLGVLHHIPDTYQAMKDCVSYLKPGAPFLVYLYYKFDNKPKWYLVVWKISDYLRRFISRSPFPIKLLISKIIAVCVYFPFAKSALLFDKLGLDTSNYILSNYKDKSFYTMSTDSLDRFGTRLEQRFTKLEIKEMMIKSGLDNISFSPNAPFHCAIGYKK